MCWPLSHFQDEFAHALAADDPAQAGEPRLQLGQPGFAIYRNTVARGCIDALAANYPAVARLVGEEWFRAAAALFSRASLPRHPALVLYGEEFTDFLRRFAPARTLPYLPGVARLDRFWTESHTARDAAPLDPRALAGLSPQGLGALVLEPHPAARWAWFDEGPIYTLWRLNREGADVEACPAWHPEGALLTRPRDAVRWRPIDPATVAFLDACAQGSCAAEAAGAALAASPATDLTTLLATLLEAGAFSGARAPSLHETDQE